MGGIVMWITRDKNEDLWLFKKKPQKQNAGFWSIESITDIIIRLLKQIFPEVKWEDEEPRELILKPIKEK